MPGREREDDYAVLPQAARLAECRRDAGAAQRASSRRSITVHRRPTDGVVAGFYTVDAQHYPARLPGWTRAGGVARRRRPFANVGLVQHAHAGAAGAGATWPPARGAGRGPTAAP